MPAAGSDSPSEVVIESAAADGEVADGGYVGLAAAMNAVAVAVAAAAAGHIASFPSSDVRSWWSAGGHGLSELAQCFVWCPIEVYVLESWRLATHGLDNTAYSTHTRRCDRRE